MIAVASGTQVAGFGDACSGEFIGKIAADLFSQLIEGGEEDGFFVFFEALQVAFGAFCEEEACASCNLEALVHELVLIGVGEEAEIDAGAPDGVAIVVVVELAVAEDGLKCFGLEGSGPGTDVSVDIDGEAAVAPETGEGFGTVVIGGTDEGDVAIAVGIGPIFGSGEVQGRLVGSLDFDDIACAAGGVIEDVLVALGDVQIVMGDGFHVEAPAGIAARAKGVVDHVADGSDAEGAHAIEGAGTHGEKLVGPEDVGFFSFGDADEITVKARDRWTSGETKGDLVEDGIGGVVVKGVEGDDLMAETLQCPGTIEAGVVRRDGGGVENLHGRTSLNSYIRLSGVRPRFGQGYVQPAMIVYGFFVSRGSMR